MGCIESSQAVEYVHTIDQEIAAELCKTYGTNLKTAYTAFQQDRRLSTYHAALYWLHIPRHGHFLIGQSKKYPTDQNNALYAVRMRRTVIRLDTVPDVGVRHDLYETNELFEALHNIKHITHVDFVITGQMYETYAGSPVRLETIAQFPVKSSPLAAFISQPDAKPNETNIAEEPASEPEGQ
jgi:hypothetical protein